MLSLPMLALAGILSLNSAAAQDASAEAVLTEVKVQATQRHVLDQRYWAGSFNDGDMTVGTARTLRLSATLDA